jgi:hypothetical protein
MAWRDVDPLEFVDEYFSQVSRSTVYRRAFAKHLQKVYYALKAIEKVDSNYGSLSHENSSIAECIYDFEAQDLIESEDD